MPKFIHSDYAICCLADGANMNLGLELCIVAASLRHDGSVSYLAGPTSAVIDGLLRITARARVIIGNNVHLAAGVMIFGNEGVGIGNFAALSSRVTIYTASDDYVEGHLTNPTIPERFKKVMRGPVVLGEHAIVGCSSIILPGVTLARGVSVGALCLIMKSIAEFSIVVGNPSRVIGQRNSELLARLEEEYLKQRPTDQNV